MSKWKFDQVYEKNGEWFGLNGPQGEIDEGRYLRQRNETAAIAKDLADQLEEVSKQGYVPCRRADTIIALLDRYRTDLRKETVMDQVKGTRDETMQIEILAHRLDSLIAEVSKLK